MDPTFALRQVYAYLQNMLADDKFDPTISTMHHIDHLVELCQQGLGTDIPPEAKHTISVDYYITNSGVLLVGMAVDFGSDKVEPIEPIIQALHPKPEFLEFLAPFHASYVALSWLKSNLTSFIMAGAKPIKLLLVQTRPMTEGELEPDADKAVSKSQILIDELVDEIDNELKLEDSVQLIYCTPTSTEVLRSMRKKLLEEAGNY